jgi:hypothetical protein
MAGLGCRASMGFGRTGGWASAVAGRAFGLGPEQKDRFSFPKSFLMQKQIPENTEYVYKAPKMPRKFQNFQEHSQRQIGA